MCGESNRIVRTNFYNVDKGEIGLLMRATRALTQFTDSARDAKSALAKMQEGAPNVSLTHLLVSLLAVMLWRWSVLLTETECLNDCAVAIDVAVLQVVEERTALTYEHYERALSAIIFTVCAHVFRQMGNTV